MHHPSVFIFLNCIFFTTTSVLCQPTLFHFNFGKKIYNSATDKPSEDNTSEDNVKRSLGISMGINSEGEGSFMFTNNLLGDGHDIGLVIPPIFLSSGRSLSNSVKILLNPRETGQGRHTLLYNGSNEPSKYVQHNKSSWNFKDSNGLFKGNLNSGIFSHLNTKPKDQMEMFNPEANNESNENSIMIVKKNKN